MGLSSKRSESIWRMYATNVGMRRMRLEQTDSVVKCRKRRRNEGMTSSALASAWRDVSVGHNSASASAVRPIPRKSSAREACDVRRRSR